MPPFWRRNSRKPAAKAAPSRTVAFSLDIPSEITGLPALGGVAPRISRREALQVPAVLRARNLIAGSLGTLPVRVHDPERRVVTDTTYLVPQPDPDIPSSVVMAQTVEDLLFEGVAWWRVTQFGWHNKPVAARHVPVTSVTIGPAGGSPSDKLISADWPYPMDGQVFIDGVPVRDNEVIRFDSPNPPLLVHAARAIRTCLLLEQTAALYAKDPLPLGYFEQLEGADPQTDEEIQQTLDDWASARAQRSWGYVQGLKAQTLQWSPEQLQLADARQHAVLEIARATGIDPEELGVSTTSRTYANEEQRDQAKLKYAFGPYVSAIQDRLSMRDVLPRGYVARIDFAGFLRSDTKTRMETYEIGLRVGAYNGERIAELEDLPSPTPGQRAAQPTPAVQPQPPRPSFTTEEPTTTRGPMYQFADDEPGARITFDLSEESVGFRVNPEKRTVSGLAVPWGQVGKAMGAKWRFLPRSLHWSDVSRVKGNVDHDRAATVGKAVRLEPTPVGLETSVQLGRSTEAKRVLEDAEDGIYDGFSIEIDFESPGDSWDYDPDDPSVRLVKRATLRAIAITGMPSFDDARITRVAASRTGETVTTPTTAEVAAAAAGNGGTTQQAPAQPVTFSQEQFAALQQSQGEALTNSLTQLFERMSLPQHDDGRPVPAGRAQVTREEPVYTFSGGGGPSLVRDAWHARVEGNSEARERLAKFGRQQEDMVQLVKRRPDIAAQFATVSTGTAAAVIPPGYRPDLYVTQLLQGRPFVDAVSKGTLTDATPFVIPRFASATGAAANHVEGTNPTDGTLTLNTVTVTPAGVSGKFVLTREIIDSANPAIDQIAFTAMREAYAQNTEAKVYAELNGANGAGGTITAGFVPSGAQAYAIVVAGLPAAWGDDLIAQTRAALAAYPFRRFGAPNRMHLSAAATSGFAAAVGTDGRPLLPSVGAQNTAGIGNAVTQGWFVDGLAATPSWSMTGDAAGDADILLYNSLDVWAWESPLLTFRFEEKSGPALVELALFGYFATRLLRPVGLVGIRHNTV